MSSLLEYKNQKPRLSENAFIAPGVFLIGEVEIGENSSVWFNSVLRGDVNPILIGKNTNIQDLSLLHTSTGRTPTIVGDEVTVGHRVILHGCEIANRVLIGMGSILLDGAKIGENTVIGAGSLVTENSIIPSGVLALGSPCKVKRELTEQEIQAIQMSAIHYVEKGKEYLEETEKPNVSLLPGN